MTEAASDKTVSSAGPVERRLSSVAPLFLSGEPKSDLRLVVAGLVTAALLLILAVGVDFGSPFWSGAVAAAGAIIGTLSLIAWLFVLPRRKAAVEITKVDILCSEIMTMDEPAVLVARDGSMAAANRAYRDFAGDVAPLALVRRDPAAAGLIDGSIAHLFDSDAGSDNTAEIDFRHLDGSLHRLVGHRLAGLEGHVLWRVSSRSRMAELSQAEISSLLAVAGCMDEAPAGMFTTDDAGILRYVNETLAGWLGYGREQLTAGGSALAHIVDGGEAVEALTGAVAADGGPVTVSAHLKPREGAPIAVAITRTSFASASDGTTSLYFTFRHPGLGHDVDELLERATARFGQLFDHAPLGMVLVTESGEIIEGNTSFRELVSVTKGAEAGQDISAFVREEDRAEVAARIAECGRGEHPQSITEVRFKGPPERVVQIFASGMAPNTDPHGHLVLYLVDMTEQRSLEVQFAQSQKMQAVGQLAGGIAHDFNNVLTAIIGFSDLLLMRHRAGDPSFADIMQIQQNANRAANLVRQLLAFSRQQTLRTEILMITDILAEISSLLRRLIGENIEFNMVHGRDLGPVKGDQGQLEQVIINLAVNARDAMPDGGTLTIRTSTVSAEESQAYGHPLLTPDRYILIEVSDTGVGIPETDIGTIFEPFFTTKPVGEGTGLGLSTVYGIIKQTGGFIFADSRPGEGATFRIFLPIHDGEVAQESAAREPAAPVQDLTGKSTILLVEDEDAVRIFASRALTKKGYTVLEANGGEAALELIDNHAGDIDLLISDVAMPEMDGPSLVRRACERRRDMKVIFISGYTEDTYRDSIDREQFSFLPKPFSLTQLARTVKDVLSE